MQQYDKDVLWCLSLGFLDIGKGIRHAMLMKKALEHVN